MFPIKGLLPLLLVMLKRMTCNEVPFASQSISNICLIPTPPPNFVNRSILHNASTGTIIQCVIFLNPDLCTLLISTSGSRLYEGARVGAVGAG